MVINFVPDRPVDDLMIKKTPISSHFFRVIICIIRDVIKKDIFNLYGLEEGEIVAGYMLHPKKLAGS
jgi:hypothetical protein